VQKNTAVALVVAGLLVAVGAIYVATAYEEPIEAATEAVDKSDVDNGANGVEASENNGMDMGTQVQTAFFAIAGAANLIVAGWIIILVSKKSTLAIKSPYIVAAAGSTFLILLYIASRTVNLPIVGIQDDVQSIEIVSKLLQAVIITLSGYAIWELRRMVAPLGRS
jgi:hypothetical protein